MYLDLDSSTTLGLKYTWKVLGLDLSPQNVLGHNSDSCYPNIEKYFIAAVLA